jgi:Protein of unknown function (DUF2877)
MTILPAHLVATPVLERLTGERSGVVLGVGATACWVDLDGFVVAITTRQVPLLPNAVALAAGSGTLQQPSAAAGRVARFAPGRIELGTLRITWDPAAPPAWDPTVPVATDAEPEALARRGAALLGALARPDGALPGGLSVGPDPNVDPNEDLNGDPNADPRAVDNRGPTPRGSATLPLRGPQQPRVGLEDVQPRGPQQPRTGFEGGHLPGPQQRRVGFEGVQPRGTQQRRVGFEGDQRRGSQQSAGVSHDVWAGVGAAGLAAPVRGTGLVETIAVVRELARVGLPTAADPDGAAGLARLFRAVRERDPEPAAGAARELLGRGPGLTPEGDDLLAAVAGTLAVLGPATGWDRPTLTSFLAAVVRPAPERTTALSATLLELAAQGRLAEPAGRLLDLASGAEAAWPAALVRLERLGHGSGRAYAAGIAATAGLLAAGASVG